MVELHCADCGKAFPPGRLVSVPYSVIEKLVEERQKLEEKVAHLVKLPDGSVGVRSGDTISVIEPEPMRLVNTPIVAGDPPRVVGTNVAPASREDWRAFGIAPPLPEVQATFIAAPPKPAPQSFNKADLLKAAPPPPPK